MSFSYEVGERQREGHKPKTLQRLLYAHKQDLAEELRLWFTMTEKNRERWSDDPVGRLIKEELTKTQNWKKRGPGNFGKPKRLEISETAAPIPMNE